MEQKAEFKTSLFGGYEKESVLKYIDDMSRTAAESEAKLQEQIEQITRSRRELEEQIAEFEKRMQDASETIDAEKGKNKKLSEMIGLLQEEIDRYKEALTPAIVLIPGKGGSLGLGETALHNAVERAVGADIT